MKKIFFATLACVMLTSTVSAQQTNDEKKTVKRSIKPKTAVKAVKPVAMKKQTVSNPSKPVKVSESK